MVMDEIAGSPDMEEDVKRIDCPLCGHRFSENELKCHEACPLSSNCRITCCPKCGHQIFRKSDTVEWIKRLLKRA